MVERFDQSAVEHSKRLLWESCKEELKGAGLVYHQRRGSDKREWIDADLEDIWAAFDALDAKSSVPPINCEATELPKIPSLCLDPVSEQVQDNTRSLLALTSVVTDLEKKFSTFLTFGGTRSEASNAVGPPACTTEATYSSVVASGQQHEQSASSTNHSSLPMKLPLRKSTSSSLPDNHDRESNVVLFGLAKCASLVGTRERVDEVLEYLTGSKLAIKDLFRLGCYKKRSGVAENATPPRPVLIKFATAWDRRMVLMQKRKFHIAHLFIKNYRAIAIASLLSKVLERIILSRYESYFTSSALQFGFKKGHSTTLCTGLINNIVSRYIRKGSKVYGCFLDASKAFDLVDHGILFDILHSHGLPTPILRFLLSWYSSQQMCVCWNSCVSHWFSVSNGIRQGSVLSPVLFAVYLDGLLQKLSQIGVGCYWGAHFVGAVCYADDIALLALCPSALRIMLTTCEEFAPSHGLKLNAEKTQLIRFGLSSSFSCKDCINFGGIALDFMDTITHLGHVLSYNLDDTSDIIRVMKDMTRKANFVQCAFPFFKQFCLSMYGSTLWYLSCKNLHIIESALNKTFNRIWNLPPHSHTRIVHCVSNIQSVSNMLYMLYRAVSSLSPLVKYVFKEESQCAYSFTGYNFISGHRHIKMYSSEDMLCAEVI